MATCKNLIPYKSFPFHGRVVLSFFILCAGILIGITSYFSNNTTSGFVCDPDKRYVATDLSTDLTQKNLIQTFCSSKYEKEYNSPIPLHAYVILNFGVALALSLIYAYSVKARIEKLDASQSSTNVVEPLQQNPQSGHRINLKSRRIPVFYLYILHLIFARFVPTLLFAVLFFFPAHFPSEFSCPWPINITNSSTVTVEWQKCTNAVGSRNTSSAIAVGVVDIICALVALTEAIYLVLKVRRNKCFGTDPQFCLVYVLEKGNMMINSNIIINSYKERLCNNKETFKIDIQYGPKGTLDKMYVRLIMQKGREDIHKIPGNKERHEIYQAYLDGPRGSIIKEITDLFLPSVESTQPPRKILVVGRPGIGKSVLTKKILLEWTRGINPFFDQKLVILLKFRLFNSEKNKVKDFKEILRIGTGLPAGDFDHLFEYILLNPKRIILIFDGLDDAKVDSDCFQMEEDTPDNYNTPMSIFSIWKKTCNGNFLPGATVITTSRPTAEHIYLKQSFERHVEILGFMKPQIKEYVRKCCANSNIDNYSDSSSDSSNDSSNDSSSPIKLETKMWSYIQESDVLLSLCYLPVSCFIMCFTLKRCFEDEDSETSLPVTLTELYKKAIRIIVWDHHPACKNAIKKKDYLNSDEHLPEEVRKQLIELQNLAKTGMENGTVIFAAEEIYHHEFITMRDCGLLNSLPNEHEVLYCFLHLTIQEFLAACQLAHNCCQTSDLERILSTYLEKPRWHLVIQFLVGLLGDKIREGKISKFFSKRFEEWVILLGTGNEENKIALLGIKYLHELQQLDILKSVSNEFMAQRDGRLRLEDLNIAPIDSTAFFEFLGNCKNLIRLEFINCQLYSYHNMDKFIKLLLNNEGNAIASLSCIGDLTNEGVKYICSALIGKYCKLTELNLVDNEITDRGAKYLSEAIQNKNCKLTKLYLESTQIGDEGVRCLCEAIKSGKCKLTELRLYRSELITHQGVEDLCNVGNNTNCKIKLHFI